MSLDTTALANALLSHALATGHVKRHALTEPTGSPGQGVTCTVVLRRWAPVRKRSGLAATSLRCQFDVALYLPMPDQAGSAVDALLWAANDALIGAYSQDFELGGQAAAVDLLGMAGDPLSGELGYTRLAGDQLYRVLTISVPVLIDNVYQQEA
jgi:hypothetical protein